MKNFRSLKVWQMGMKIASACFALRSGLPSSEKYGLGSQMTRAGVSIPSNIAEGSSRSSQKEFRHFIEISIGSCFELETQLLLARQLSNSNLVLIDQILANLDVTEKMLSSLRNRIGLSI